MISVYKSQIDSETVENLKYDLLFIKWDDEEFPREIICSCKGYKYNEKCKHIDKYDPQDNEIWKNAKKI